MATPPPMPDLRPPGSLSPRSRLVLVGVAIFVALFLVALGAGAWWVAERVQAQKKSREATRALKQTADEVREEMAAKISSGEVQGAEAATGRIREQLEKSAGQLTGSDAAAMRALAAFTGQLQAEVGKYEAATSRFVDAGVFSPKEHDRALLASHRQLVRDFLASNAGVTDKLQHAEELLRAALEREKVAPKTLEQTLAGFTSAQLATRDLQLRIRAADQHLGEAALATLDLLEKHWASWEYSAKDEQILFRNNDAALQAYNDLMEKVQTIAADQEKAQTEMIATMRARAKK